MVGDLARWLRDEEANACERAPVMGADDRPNLTATDHSMWHPVELTHAGERQRQRDQLPNHALLDQGSAWGTAGPALAPGSAWRGPPAARRATAPEDADQDGPDGTRTDDTQRLSLPDACPTPGHRRLGPSRPAGVAAPWLRQLRPDVQQPGSSGWEKDGENGALRWSENMYTPDRYSCPAIYICERSSHRTR